MVWMQSERKRLLKRKTQQDRANLAEQEQDAASRMLQAAGCMGVVQAERNRGEAPKSLAKGSTVDYVGP